MMATLQNRGLERALAERRWETRSERFFAPGVLLRHALDAEPIGRNWRELRRGAGFVEVLHASGAVARVMVDDQDRFRAAHLLDAAEPNALVRAHRHRVPPRADAVARRSLKRGRPLPEAITALSHKLEGRLTPLRPIEGEPHLLSTPHFRKPRSSFTTKLGIPSPSSRRSARHVTSG